jgi:hypothetical protein
MALLSTEKIPIILLNCIFFGSIGFLCFFLGKTCVYGPLMTQRHVVMAEVVQQSISTADADLICSQQEEFSNIRHVCRRTDGPGSAYYPISLAQAVSDEPADIADSTLPFEPLNCEITESQRQFEGYRNVSKAAPVIPKEGAVVRLLCRNEVHTAHTRFDLGPWTCSLRCEDLYKFEKVCPEGSYPYCNQYNSHLF